METTYAILDEKNIIVNIILAEKDNVEILEKAVEAYNATSYKEIDLEIYNGKVGHLYWNGTNWDKVIPSS